MSKNKFMFYVTLIFCLLIDVFATERNSYKATLKRDQFLISL